MLSRRSVEFLSIAGACDFKMMIPTWPLRWAVVIDPSETGTGDNRHAVFVVTESEAIWEANRKIFLYPEDWMDPALRDDKTPFFQELENELLQADVTNDTAEAAILNYLRKLDRVSKLEVMGIFFEENRSRRFLAVFSHGERSDQDLNRRCGRNPVRTGCSAGKLFTTSIAATC